MKKPKPPLSILDWPIVFRRGELVRAKPKPRLCVLGGVNCQSPHAAWVKGEK